jgi:NAD(P)-dependent dehydrogenase (short-subunit alcohol dehydrogenase family)
MLNYGEHFSEHFGEPWSAIVFGASGGIGAAAAQLLAENSNAERVYAGSRNPGGASGKIIPFAFDLLNESSIAGAAQYITEQNTAPPRLIFIATGMLHSEGIQPEKSYRGQSGENYAAMFGVNAAGPALVGKYFLPLMPRSGRTVFAAVSAKVGSISDNRLGGWHAYRASKAALNMIVRNFAVEIARTNPDAFAVTLHPGTVDTALSQPFQRGVPDGKLFTPQHSAQAMLRVLSGLQEGDSGKLFAWDGAEIAY